MHPSAWEHGLAGYDTLYSTSEGMAPYGSICSVRQYLYVCHTLDVQTALAAAHEVFACHHLLCHRAVRIDPLPDCMAFKEKCSVLQSLLACVMCTGQVIP